MEKNITKKLGWNYFWLAMTAFGGLGLEILWAFLVEPMLYGAPMQEWTAAQNILHWTITCVTWGLVALWVVHDAQKSCGFYLMEKGETVFKKRNIPYGGIICGLTWGLAHIFTKGSLVTGANGLVYGFLFGVAYLVVGRDIKKTWLVLFLMFAF